MLASQRDQRRAGSVLHIAASTTVSRPAAKRFRAMKCSSSNASGSRLIVFAVRHHRAAGIGRDDLGRSEVRARKGRLAGSRRADQHHQGQLRNGDPGSRGHSFRNRRIVAARSVCDSSCALALARWAGRITRLIQAEDRHLRWRAQRPHRPRRSAACAGHSRAGWPRLGPRRELGPRPLEVVIAVAQLARGRLLHLALYSALASSRPRCAVGVGEHHAPLGPAGARRRGVR